MRTFSIEPNEVPAVLCWTLLQLEDPDVSFTRPEHRRTSLLRLTTLVELAESLEEGAAAGKAAEYTGPDSEVGYLLDQMGADGESRLGEHLSRMGDKELGQQGMALICVCRRAGEYVGVVVP